MDTSTIAPVTEGYSALTTATLVTAAGLLGVVVGLLLSRWIAALRGRTTAEVAQEVIRMADAAREREVAAVVQTVRESFGNLSMSALGRASEQLTAMNRAQLQAERDLHGKDLDARKGLIDQNLQHLGGQLEQVTNLVKSLEKDRESKFGELSSRLASTNEQTASLIALTASLRETLSSSQARGQWGERIADDILRLAGFVENVSYQKQVAIAGVGTRPDFTFILPSQQTINMDVKFPIANYMRLIEASSPADKDRARRDFFADVRARIREVRTRGYINMTQNTVDCVLLFIPNEQVFSYIQSEEPGILDEALRNKVVCCSPMTLFAVLAVIRQAVQNFAVERTSRDILDQLAEFRRQWDKFTEKLDGLGSKIAAAQKEFEAVVTTRRRQLERPLEKLDALHQETLKLGGVIKDGPDGVLSGTTAGSAEIASTNALPSISTREVNP